MLSHEMQMSKNKVDFLPDGDPQKVRQAFVHLFKTLVAMKACRRWALEQLQAWTVIMSQKEIAARIRVSPQYLSDLLKRRRELSEPVIFRIATLKLNKETPIQEEDKKK